MRSWPSARSNSASAANRCTEHVAWPYRFRLRAFAEELDSELGPLEHAALYLDAAGARRLTAVFAAHREDDR